MNINNLEHLITELDNCDPSNVDNYLEIMKAVSFDETAVKDHLAWNQTPYTRNSLKKTDNYELVLLCWDAGQESPIHNHTGSDGWVRGLLGEIVESRYTLNDGTEPKLIAETTVKPGMIAHINDQLGIHKLSNKTDKKAASLHLYVSPLAGCETYNDDETPNADYINNITN